MAGAGIRQFLPLNGVKTFGDTSGAIVPFAEATTVRGAALKDRAHRFDGVIRPVNGKFAPGSNVNRADLAYSLVQSPGLQEVARAFNGELTVATTTRAYRSRTRPRYLLTCVAMCRSRSTSRS